MANEPDTTDIASHISQGPARGYSWEPFKPGHTKSLKHGARSERVIAPLTAEIANGLMQNHERLQNPLYRETVLEYSRLLAQVEVLEAYIDEHGTIIESGDKAGKVQPAAEYLLKVRKQATNVADKLGLNPLANARLGKDTAAGQLDLTKIFAAIQAQAGEGNSPL
ncbi:P27 family phage terminase small subunit [Rhodococcus daqingensis]|uniref:P27 family phage terminase small subunit n=1 Tax=Rhodococcus daqingensis TaxID=2479363 RepID=A0ABW2RYT6_9NOCA